jgi:hypothetical protein
MALLSTLKLLSTTDVLLHRRRSERHTRGGQTPEPSSLTIDELRRLRTRCNRRWSVELRKGRSARWHHNRSTHPSRSLHPGHRWIKPSRWG